MSKHIVFIGAGAVGGYVGGHHTRVGQNVTLVDPWPEYWSDRWYETDDVYIDYNEGGYYLVNRRRPGDRIAVNVFVN